MAEVGLHGKPVEHAELESGEYESPEEYADQGDTRKIKDLMFGYTIEVEDPSGAKVIEPREARRGEEVTIEQIGLIALRKGEQSGAFFTSKELETLDAGGSLSSSVELPEAGLSEQGEYELADWLKGEAEGQTKAPTVNEVLEAVGDDRDLAARMLQAENIATDNEPRKSLEAGLQRIASGA